MEEKGLCQMNECVVALLESLEHRISSKDMSRIKEAYELAKEAHSGQARKSGEPYIVHPVAVACIIANELELGANPIIAAFLHDVVEDTDYTIEDIREKFGDDVAFLVNVVTKKKKEKYEKSKQVDNYRQILESVKYDVRALLIKLADRLHNMRTLSSISPDKQMKIAGETEYFYAPLANRLGLYHVKSELENLSFKYRCPREYAEIEGMLEREKRAEEPRIKEFTNEVDEIIRTHGEEVRIEVLYRTPFSVWRKMIAENCDFYHASSKHYIRVIYTAPNQRDFNEKDSGLWLYSLLTSRFKEKPGSVTNYIDTPKENGYQSFHVKLLSRFGEWEEIHISSERMVRNSRLGCAAERTEGNINKWLEKFKAVLLDAARHTQEMEFMDGVTSSFYNDDIMVFTPQGKGVVLPKGATAIDFAYEVHSKVGDHAVYARINGKLSSIKTVLRRGDCVEIITDEKSLPPLDWIDHAVTYKAKRNLKISYTNRPSIPYIRCPHCHPLPGDEVIGFRGEGDKLTIHKRNCPIAIRMASQQGDSIVAVNFEVDENILYPVRIRIRSVDRYHLLSDLITCITDQQHLSMNKLMIEGVDGIFDYKIDFGVHSVEEVHAVLDAISAIDGVDEVFTIDIE